MSGKTIERSHADTHSFILKIWQDQGDHTGEDAIWQGRLTHVFDGEFTTVNEFTDIVTFMQRYLMAMGVGLDDEVGKSVDQ